MKKAQLGISASTTDVARQSLRIAAFKATIRYQIASKFDRLHRKNPIRWLPRHALKRRRRAWRGRNIRPIFAYRALRALHQASARRSGTPRHRKPTCNRQYWFPSPKVQTRRIFQARWIALRAPLPPCMLDGRRPRSWSHATE